MDMAAGYSQILHFALQKNAFSWIDICKQWGDGLAQNIGKLSHLFTSKAVRKSDRIFKTALSLKAL